MTGLVSARDLTVHFPAQGGGTVHAVDGLTLDVQEGETLGIIGESGSGKSTLGRALVRLTRPTGGAVLHRGRDLSGLRGAEARQDRLEHQIVFQDPAAALNPRMRILDSVREPLDIANALPKAARNRAALALLERVGLRAAFAESYPHELSGGQKQRVNIARVLATEPKLIVCDEVVAALDVSLQADILNLFVDLQRERGFTYAFITHDLGVVGHVSDRIAVMYLGRLVELGPSEAIMETPLHPYTQALLSAEPVPLPATMRPDRRIRLQGEIPSPINPPSGCRFRTRCPWATPLCTELPEWRSIGEERWVACHYATADGHKEPAS